MYTINPKAAATRGKKYNKWTDEELIFLKENYNKFTEKTLSKKLNRSKVAIFKKYKKTFSGKETPSINNVKNNRPIADRSVSTDLVMYILNKNQGIGIRDCVNEVLMASE